MSKYATAISKETGIAHTTVQGVEMADKPIDETQLAEELKVTPSRLCMPCFDACASLQLFN